MKNHKFQFFSEWFALLVWGGDLLNWCYTIYRGPDISVPPSSKFAFVGSLWLQNVWFHAKWCDLQYPSIAIPSHEPLPLVINTNVLCNDIICHSFRGVPFHKSLHTELMLIYTSNFAGWNATCKLCNNPECNPGSSTLLQKKFEMENNCSRLSRTI